MAGASSFTFRPDIDADLQRFFIETFVDSDSDDDELEFEGFTDEDIRGRPVDLVNSGRDHEVVADTHAGWASVDGDGPVCAPFTGGHRFCRVVSDDPSPLEFFNCFFDDVMWDVLVQQTNLYAQNRLATDALRHQSRMQKWVPVTVSEMKVFIAVVMSMGLNGKADLESYWSTDDVLQIPFYSKVMTRDRFLLILSNLHISDNNNRAVDDPLAKVRPFLSMIQHTFIDVYTPGRDISFDEATCPWKGRLRFKVYNPNKPNKFGIKLYQANESSTSYTIAFDIYTGKNEGPNLCHDMAELVGVDAEANTTTKLVVGLLASCGLLDKGHHIYLDNYYTSPELFDELQLHNTYACGTVRRNRRDVPKAMTVVKKISQGDAIFRRRNGLLAVKFHDKRDVNMLSTIHSADAVRVVSRDRSVVTKPTCIADYTRLMRGVDLSDQLGQYYTLIRRTIK